MQRISVVLADDDNLIVREGVRALLALDPDIEVVGVAGDQDQLVEQCREHAPQVLVTDIRMPPNFQDEGIEGAKEVRRRAPGTGVVVRTSTAVRTARWNCWPKGRLGTPTC